MDAKVSVIIPAYQAERTLGATLASARCQTYANLEIVVCNDGSTDGTRAIAAAFDPHVRLVDQANAGLPAARNAAIRAATGDYIAILDADDLLLPTYVASLLHVLSSQPQRRAFVCANSYLMSSRAVVTRAHWTGRHPRGTAQRLAQLEKNIATGFAIFPKAMWVELGGYAEEMRACEDYDFWSRAIFSGWEVLFEDRPLALYRYESGSMSADPERMNTYEKLMRQRLAAQFRDRMTEPERELLDRSLQAETVDWYLTLEAEALASGEVGEAARLCRAASELRPSDRSLQLKARLLRWAPATGHLYAWRAGRRATRG